MIKISHLVLDHITKDVTETSTLSLLDSRIRRSNVHCRNQCERGPRCSWYIQRFLHIINSNALIINNNVLSPQINECSHHKYPFLMKGFLIFLLVDLPTLFLLVHVCGGLLDATVFRSEYQSLVHRCKVCSNVSTGGAGDEMQKRYKAKRVIPLNIGA